MLEYGIYLSLSDSLPNPGIEPWSPASQADSLLFKLQGSPALPCLFIFGVLNLPALIFYMYTHTYRVCKQK